MDIVEVEESFFAACDAKLHAGMCKELSMSYCKILGVFPDLEEARPRSKSGIQALCSLHVALEKGKNILQHCSECSKLYLAITGDSVLVKFDRARCALVDSLRRVEDIVPQSIGCQINEIVHELEATVFSLNPSEKQTGDELIALLQQGRNFNDCNDQTELESFHQAATKLGITSPRTALTERRALKKLIDRARAEEDKRKESIVAYLLHLMRKYSKYFRTDFSDDNDSQGSNPCSPTVRLSFESNGHPYEKQFSKVSSFNFRPSIRRSGPVPVPPEELRCSISLQLMHDPVIISSGQTYERICIEKWFSDGHNTCPKTQQKLAHIGLTPNYCVKGLIASWCEQNEVPVPAGPPESLDLNYWRLTLSESETADSRSTGSCKLKGVKVVPLQENGSIKEEPYKKESNFKEEELPNVFERHKEFLAVLNERHAHDQELVSNFKEEELPNVFERHKEFLAVLNERHAHDQELVEKCKVVEQIRVLLKDDEEARVFMGDNGFVGALLQFLKAALQLGNQMAQEVGAMALFNLAVNNDRNKQMILSANAMPLFEDMIANRTSRAPATALYLNLSCLDEAKPTIGSSQAVPTLISILRDKSSERQCKLDALHTLYNLSTHNSIIQRLMSSGLVSALQSLLANLGDHTWTERSIAVLINLASNQSGKDTMASSADLIGTVASILDTGEAIEQEQAVMCLYVLCSGNEKCIDMVLEEGVIPALVSVSVNGTVRGKEKSQKLLLMFREHRRRDQSPPPRQQQKDQSPPPRQQQVTKTEMTGLSKTKSVSVTMPISHSQEVKPLRKSGSTRRIVKGWSLPWKNKRCSSAKEG